MAVGQHDIAEQSWYIGSSFSLTPIQAAWPGNEAVQFCTSSDVRPV